MTNDTPRWSAAIQNKEKLTKDDAVFIFDQAEKMLKDSVETATIIVERASTQLTIISTVIVALTAYIIDQVDKNKMPSDIGIAAVAGVIYFIILGIYTLKNIQPHSYKVTGSMPKELFSDPFFIKEIADSERILRFYVSEIENYQCRIEQNSSQNKKRWLIYKRTLWAMMLSPIMFVAAYFISMFIRNLCWL